MECYFKPWKSSQLQAKAKQRNPWAFMERTSALQETNASPIAKKKQRKAGMVAWNNARSRCVTKMQLLTPWIQKIMIQQRRQLAWPAPKTDSRELLLLTHGATNEMAFGCTNAQTANMDTTGTGGILIAAPGARAVARAPTISPLRSIYASNWTFTWKNSKGLDTTLTFSQQNFICSFFNTLLTRLISLQTKWKNKGAMIFCS